LSGKSQTPTNFQSQIPPSPPFLKGGDGGIIKTKWPIPALEVSAIKGPFLISFPNTGGKAVSSHALTAVFHIPLNQDLGKWLGDYSIFNLKDFN
jgi:hypothetical protein